MEGLAACLEMFGITPSEEAKDSNARLLRHLRTHCRKWFSGQSHLSARWPANQFRMTNGARMHREGIPLGDGVES